MPIGISNVTSTTLQNITDIGNSTSLPELFVKVNHIVYGGYLYFILLLLTVVILFFIAQAVRDQFLNNLTISFAVASLAAIFIRVIEIQVMGLEYWALLTDPQYWFFWITTILLTGILWMTKEK